MKPIVPLLLAWYAQHKRPLPWRETRDPYPIWLSEVILQQTRVAQGMPYWVRYIETYPTLEALAAAPDEEVMRLWQGLGYYSRARNMLKAARTIAKHGWPQSAQELSKLPGIGPYTAAAIASFAFKEAVAVLDGNVMRVLARLYLIRDDITQPSTHKLMRALAQELIPLQEPDAFNQAIMEFGALQCTPTSPKCLVCPLLEHCDAAAAGAQNEVPFKKTAKPKKERHFHYLLLESPLGMALHQRSDKDIWQDLFEPILYVVEGPRIQPDWAPYTAKEISHEQHLLTHQLIHITFWKATVPETVALPEGFNWYGAHEVEQLAKPKPIVEALRRYPPDQKG